MREWVATKDISDGRFNVRRGMSVPRKYSGAMVISFLRKKHGTDAFVPRSQFKGAVSGDANLKAENDRLKIELATVKSELRKLQKREPVAA